MSREHDDRRHQEEVLGLFKRMKRTVDKHKQQKEIVHGEV
jgi:hypothetical protein